MAKTDLRPFDRQAHRSALREGGSPWGEGRLIEQKKNVYTPNLGIVNMQFKVVILAAVEWHLEF